MKLILSIRSQGDLQVRFYKIEEKGFRLLELQSIESSVSKFGGRDSGWIFRILHDLSLQEYQDRSQGIGTCREIISEYDKTLNPKTLHLPTSLPLPLDLDGFSRCGQTAGKLPDAPREQPRMEGCQKPGGCCSCYSRGPESGRQKPPHKRAASSQEEGWQQGPQERRQNLQEQHVHRRVMSASSSCAECLW